MTWNINKYIYIYTYFRAKAKAVKHRCFLVFERLDKHCCYKWFFPNTFTLYTLSPSLVFHTVSSLPGTLNNAWGTSLALRTSAGRNSMQRSVIHSILWPDCQVSFRVAWKLRRLTFFHFGDKYQFIDMNYSFRDFFGNTTTPALGMDWKWLKYLDRAPRVTTVTGWWGFGGNGPKSVGCYRNFHLWAYTHRSNIEK